MFHPLRRAWRQAIIKLMLVTLLSSTLSGLIPPPLVRMMAPPLAGLLPATQAALAATTTFTIGASSDDAAQTMTTNAVTLNSTVLNLPNSTTPTSQQIGLRFTNVTIPQGATINSAYLQFTASAADSSSTIHLTIRGEAVDNAATFTTSTNNIASRPSTGASVAWSNVPAWTAGATQQTPDLKTIVQEIVNRAGWASGNSLALILADNGTSANNIRRRATSFDGSAANSPQLVIDYTGSARYRIGNLIWRDLDNDGVVDANEPGVPGVPLKLYANYLNFTAIATTTTDINGVYWFDWDQRNNQPIPATYNGNPADYHIAIDDPLNQPSLAGCKLSGPANGPVGAHGGLWPQRPDKEDNVQDGWDNVPGINKWEIWTFYLTGPNATLPWPTGEVDAHGATGASAESYINNTSGVTVADGQSNLYFDIGLSCPTTLSIVKQSSGGDGSFDFTSPNATLNALQITTVGGAASSAVMNMNPGVYTLSEDALAGWNLTDVTCTGDADNGSVVTLASRQVTIDLDSGENMVCTFSNTAQSSSVTPSGVLTITKSVLGSSNSGPYNITVNGPNGYVTNTTVTAGTPKVLSGLAGGVYTVTEQSPGADWTTIYTATPGAGGASNAVVTLSGATIARTSAGNISGKVYRDYNSNGVFDTSGVAPNLAIDTGVAGVTVTAYDVNGAIVGTPQTSNATGDYTINPGAVQGPYRIEFTNLPAGYEPTTHGPSAGSGANGTSVQFVPTGGATNVNFGIQQPCDYCQPAPPLVTTLFNRTLDSAATALLAVAYPDVYTGFFGSTATVPFETLATADRVGAVYGLAWQRSSASLFAGAFAKHEAPYGPGGPAAIYRIDPLGPTTSLFLNFDTYFGAGSAGPNSTIDQFDVGKVALGDVDLSDDGNTLYTVNLFSKQLYVVPIGSPPVAPVSAASIGVHAMPVVADCPAIDVRPMALGVYNGKLYVGLVCSAESTTSDANLRAYVYEFDPGSAIFTQKLNFSLPYARFNFQTFSFWRTNLNGGSQPMLSDIEFDGGDMVLGFRSRNADMFTGIQVTVGGDTLRACATAPGTWSIENAGVCGGVAQTIPAVSAWTGVAPNIQGPGGSEWYWDDDGKEGEAAQGGLAIIRGRSDVFTTQMDGLDGNHRAGFFAFNNQTGAVSGGATVLQTQDRFNKGNNMGDLEVLCDPAPIEIGNRVWNDYDGDGVQDAGEPGLPSVQVSLQGPTGTVTTSTDANGLYYFNHLKANSAYTLTLNVPAGYSLSAANQAALSGASTQSNHAISDTLDSDAALVGGVATIYYSTGSAGQNNHGLDFGFTQPVTGQVDILNTYTPTILSCTNPKFWTGSLYNQELNSLVSNIRNFDWSSSGSGSLQGIASLASPLPTGAATTLRHQAHLVTLNDPTGNTVPFSGLNTVSEYTLVAQVPMTVSTTSLGGGILLHLLTSLPGGAFYIYHDSTPNRDVATGVGFDDGTLVASGIITGNQVNSIQYNSGSANGSIIVEGITNYVNPAFLDIAANIEGIRLEGTLNAPPLDSTTTTFFAGRSGEGSYSTYTVTGSDTLLKVDTSSKFLECRTDYDYGDLPDSASGVAVGNYQTLITDSGPSHVIVPGLYLGARVDAEVNGQPNSAATGDDSNHSPDGEGSGLGSDDEDGVQVVDLALSEGSAPGVRVNATNLTTQTATLYGFIDFNGDGDFADAGETASVSLPTGSNNVQVTLNFGVVPLGSATSSYARFRLSRDVAAAQPSGAAGDGEVEDYPVTIGPIYDWGDLPDTGSGVGAGNYATLTSDNGPRHRIVADLYLGVAVDNESDGQPNASATGDDNNPAGADDEEGVRTSDLALTQGVVASIHLTATNSSNANAILYGFVDFNGDGDFNDGDETQQTLVPVGSNNTVFTLTFSVPLTATTGTSYARFRLSSDGAAAQPTGAASNGEVEDYPVTITPLLISLGNLVWYDLNNDGLYDADGANNTAGDSDDEAPIAGVRVELFRDSDGDGQLVGSEQTPVAVDVTDAGGLYLFTQKTDASGNPLSTPVLITPGNYLVGIPASNFADGQVLKGFHSSLTTASSDGALDESEPTDPDSGAMPGIDNDDSGSHISSGFYDGGVLSLPVTLAAGSEPQGENPDNDPTTPDANENLTVDFGFYSVRLGNQIFRDDDNSGHLNNSEPGIDGVTVYLYTADGAGLISTTTTSGGGFYQFNNLAQGSYMVAVETTSATLTGLASSTGANQSGAPNDNINSDDNGVTTSGSEVRSNVVTLTPGTAGSQNNNSRNTPNGITTDPTVDFGFTPVYSLGNRVWNDNGAGGGSFNDGLQNGAEPGLDNVVVRLLDSSGQQASDLSGAQVADQTTSSGGYYRFDNLLAGDYIVEIVAANFGGVLSGYSSSSGSGQEAEPDDDGDRNDNGLDTPLAGAIRSAVVTLGPLSASEPIGESDIASPNPSGEAPNAQSNLTVDFGFVQILSLGNQLWYDVDNDGLYEAGDGEQPIVGVAVQLYQDSNNSGQYEAGVDSEVNVGPDGVLGTGDDASGGLLTNASGQYLFSGLAAGDYLVLLPESNFTGAGVLVNYQNSDPTVTGNSDQNNRDHGAVVGSLGQAGGYVASSVVTLSSGGEPASPSNDDGDANNNSNLTIDFGFYTLSLGNLVWEDANNDGTKEATEDGLPNVPVELLDENGNLVQSTQTDASGLYTFTNLMSGTYQVRITPSAGYTTSTGSANAYEPAPDPDNNLDDDDNGTASSGGQVTSGLITLVPGDAGLDEANDVDYPTGATYNPTLDFGLWQPLSLGNLVWFDRNNDGLYDADGLDNTAGNGDDEAGLDNVAVRLYNSLDQLISSTLTSGGGLYLFRHLLPGDYYVEVDVPTGYRSSSGGNGSVSGPYEAAPDPDTASVDNDDNGTTQAVTTTVRSGLVTLSVAGEPLGENPDNDAATPDANENLTVDFGFYQPLSLGNRIWHDRNNDGLLDSDGLDNVAGTGDDESGFDQVQVNLYWDADNNGAIDGGETTPILGQLTQNGGYYLFDLLAPGNYLVELDDSNFTGIAPLVGYTSSSGNGSEPGPDADSDVDDSDDNGAINGLLGNGGSIRSELVTLTVGGEPTGEGDLSPDGSGSASDLNSNLTVDFGLYHLLNLGNLVWLDADNNGVVNGLESGIANVTVQLYQDINGSGAYEDGVDTEVSVGPDGIFGTNDDATGGMLTDASGHYTFTQLPAGEYLVVLPNSNFEGAGRLLNYLSSTGGGSEPAPDVDSDAENNDDNGATQGALGAGGLVTSNAITLSPGDEPTDDGDTDADSNLSVDFGFFQLAGLGDRVWYDVNLNGVQDDPAGEPGVDGITVTLYNGAGDLITTTVTSNGGAYAFTGLPPGQYYVVFRDLPPGYVLTGQDVNGNTGDDGDNTDSDADPATGQTVVATLASDEFDPSWDAGVYQLAGLGDYVWEDLDRDGQQDANEPGVPNVTVNLLDGNGNIISTTTTTPVGYYFFGNLTPSIPYQVQFVPPTGYNLTPRDTVTDSVDSDADPTPGADYGRTPQVTLAANESNPTLDAGLYRPASLGDYIWSDNDLDGVQDNNEVGVPNVTVNLYVGDQLTATTTTNASGYYSFPNLLPGAPYQVEFVLPTGYEFSPQDSPNASDATDSDADRATGFTTQVTLASGEHNPTLDAGIYALASIGDYVWLDSDGDGVQDNNENGVPNVPVNLYQPGQDGQPGGGDDILVDSTTTNVNGRYTFTNLVPGSYFVQFDPPAGYTVSPQDAPNDDALDSDADPTSGQTVVTTLVAGENDLTWDLGLYEPVRVGDYVWYDDDGDGQQDDGEAGVSGVVVTLYNNATGQPVTDGASQPVTDTTDVNGFYLFDNLPPGDYYVLFNLNTLPSSYLVTRQNVGDDATDSDGNPATGRTGATGFLPSGGENLTLDLGIYLPVTVGDYVWYDNDYDGVQEQSETGVPGVTAALYDATTGQPYLVNGQPLTAVTDNSGLYLFANLPPGDYYVLFDLSTLPAGYAPTKQDINGDSSDSDADPISGETPATGFLPSGGADLTLDLGIYQPVTVGDYVWYDNDYDGQQDAAEIGVPGVAVHLYDTATGQPVLDVNNNALIDVTDNNGLYLFDNLPPGDYYVVFDLNTLPVNYLPTKQNSGPNSSDSDADPQTGATASTGFLPSGAENLTLDLGIYAPVTVGDYVWNDGDHDGQQENGEPGVAGVKVTLYAAATGQPVQDGNNQPLTDVTDNSGLYLFANLPPGDYYVVFDLASLPTGYAPTRQNVGNDASDSDADPSTGQTASTGFLPSGAENLTLDLGVWPPLSLGNLVWGDTNNNGVVDGTEAGLGNVLVNLYSDANQDGQPDGPAIISQHTNATGHYLFTGLQAGAYIVEVIPPEGYTSSTGGASEPAPDADSDADDHDDNGSTNGNAIRSAAVTLSAESEPQSEGATPGLPDNTPDANSNVTVDFGLWQAVALGNVVFADWNNNGKFELALGEAGIGGVLVELFAEGANPATATPIATTTTNADGYYLFDNLLPGRYFVHIPAENFQSSGVLREVVSSTGNGSSQSVDDNQDENGIDQSNPETSGISSSVYNLQPNSQPTSEAGEGHYLGVLGDDDVNLTADFGFFQLLNLGNRVWLDHGGGGGGANNGVMDSGEQGIAGVVLSLWDNTGQPVLDRNGQPQRATTDAKGYYLFDDLPPGEYVVRVDASNFQTGNPLAGLRSSGPTESDPNSDVDVNDNGVNDANPSANGIQSGLVRLGYKTEPQDDDDKGALGNGKATNDNSNLTIDFGFASPTSLGDEDEPKGSLKLRLFLPVIVR